MSRTAALSRPWPTIITRSTASRKPSFATVNRFGIPTRDELLVVRELALDQPRGDLGTRRAERDLALAEHDLDLTVAGEPLHLREALRRDEHLLTLGQHADAAKITHREPVGVGCDESEAAGLRREQHTGEDRSQVVLRRGPNHLSQRTGERRRVDAHTLALTDPEARVLLRGLQAQRRGEAAARDVGLVVDGDGDGALLELAHDLAEQLRDDGHTGLVDLRRHPDPVRDLEVGADELDPVGVGGDPEVGQHRERTRATGDGPLHRGDGFGEGVPLASGTSLQFSCHSREKVLSSS